MLYDSMMIRVVIIIIIIITLSSPGHLCGCRPSGARRPERAVGHGPAGEALWVSNITIITIIVIIINHHHQNHHHHLHHAHNHEDDSEYD